MVPGLVFPPNLTSIPVERRFVFLVRQNKVMLSISCCDHRKNLLRFLLLKTAVVRRGVKPGELLRVRRCFMEETLSGEPVCLHRRDILEILELDYIELLVERDSSLVLFYHAEAMEQTLRDPANRAILTRCGYSADADVRALLSELQQRFQSGSDLPHEVGVFLGYPAKDVAGFIANLPRTPVEHGRWAVYGDAGESVARMALYRRIEAAAERVLNVCGDTRTFLEYISTFNQTTGVM